MNRDSATSLLEEAIGRCKWTALDQRYSQRLSELRKEAGASFESPNETIRIQCRAFHDAMDEMDRARREAVTKANRRRAEG